MRKILIRCMDPRMAGPVTDWMRKHNCLGFCYEPSPAGGCQVLAGQVTIDQDVMHRYISLAVGGGATEVILINHTDCAAYKAAGHNFVSRDEEIAFHRAELAKAGNYFAERFPQLQVTHRLIAVTHGDQVESLIEA